MSQRIISATTNGEEIQSHLENIYDELISNMFDNEIENQKTNSHKQATECMGCGSPVTYIIWSKSYSGYRGKCMVCNHNWPES